MLTPTRTYLPRVPYEPIELFSFKPVTHLKKKTKLTTELFVFLLLFLFYWVSLMLRTATLCRYIAVVVWMTLLGLDLNVWFPVGGLFRKDYEVWPWRSCVTVVGFEVSEANTRPILLPPPPWTCNLQIRCKRSANALAPCPPTLMPPATVVTFPPYKPALS